MDKKLLLAVLFAAIILSGCTNTGQQQQFQYSNNIVTVENYGVTTTNPYPGSDTSINFWVKNNGDRPVTVTVDFFNVPSNLGAFITCSDFNINNTAPHPDVIVYNLNCTFLNLQPFDTRPVKFDMTIPNITVNTPVPYTIAYSISYNWNGYRSASIPVVDGTTRTKPVSQFSQSQPTYGPILVSFQPPVGATYEQNNQVITENWGLAGRPFQIEMQFTHVGSPPGTVEQPIVINSSITNPEIVLNYTGIEPASGTYCSFQQNANGQYVYPKPLEIPDSLACNFKNSPNAPLIAGELTGTVSVNYTYNYMYERTETIIEQPNPQ